MIGTPPTYVVAAALLAVKKSDPAEVAAVIVSFDQMRHDLAELAESFRRSNNGSDFAERVDVLTVRARQALIGFYDRAELLRELPAPPAADAPAPAPAGRKAKGGAR